MRKVIIILVIAGLLMAGTGIGGYFVYAKYLSQAQSEESEQVENPINFFFVLHVEPTKSPQQYEKYYEDLMWTCQEAKKYGIKLTILMNGSFAEYALAKGNQDEILKLLDEGHELGTHAHGVIRVGEFKWVDVKNKTSRFASKAYDAQLVERTWKDNDEWVDKLIGPENNKTMCAQVFKASDEGKLCEKYGYINTAGDRSEIGLSYIGHLIYHPFRPASDDTKGHELEEDLKGNFVSFDHYAQIGSPKSHGTDCTVEALKKAFEEEVKAWKNATGDEKGKVWTFSLVHHPGAIQYRNDISEFMKWMSENYLNKKDENGRVIAASATVKEIRQKYDTWEKANPGESSFSYVTDNPPATPIEGGQQKAKPKKSF